MAEDFVLPEDGARTVPTRFEKILKAIIIAAALCLGGELVWLVGITPFRPFSRIDISGYDGIPREEILARAGVGKFSSYVSSDKKSMEQALAGLSAVESVRVFKHFPDRLQILIEGRQAVACAVANLEGKSVPVLLDAEGVIFQVGGNGAGDSPETRLPLVSGLVIEEPRPGMRLPVLFLPLFEELGKIGAAAPELLGAVSELRINRKAYDGFDIVLYPAHKKIKVRLSELNEDMLRYTLLMVDVLASNESGINSLDFRAGIASYIPKEESSEQ